MAFMVAVTSFLYWLQRASLLSYLQGSLRGPRETVDLPSHDEMEHDERENADEGAWRERIDQQYGCRYDPNHPNHHTHSPKAPATRERVSPDPGVSPLEHDRGWRSGR